MHKIAHRWPQSSGEAPNVSFGESSYCSVLVCSTSLWMNSVRCIQLFLTPRQLHAFGQRFQRNPYFCSAYDNTTQVQCIPTVLAVSLQNKSEYNFEVLCLCWWFGKFITRIFACTWVPLRVTSCVSQYMLRVCGLMWHRHKWVVLTTLVFTS